jgi:TRAP-type mannitol/chloroaromatic compound transport system permease small subunit
MLAAACRVVRNRASLLVAPLLVANTNEVFMFGVAYALQKGAHVRTDMFWEKFSDRSKGRD